MEKISIWIGMIIASIFDEAIFQTVFQAEDLQLKYFSDCCGHADCERPGDPNYYRYLAVSEDGQYVWVGAMNYLFKLDINDLTCQKYLNISVNQRTTTRCTVQGKSLRPDCQNHIRTVIEMGPKELFVCGTGAYSPVDYTLNSQNLRVEASSLGIALCPYDPLDNYTAIKIDQGNPFNSSALYIGTYTDFIKNFPVFFRPEYTVDGTTYIRKSSDSEDINWLYSPQFVGSFDEEDSVFFFFREIAIETPSDDRKIFSRVGKVCKKDQGGGRLEIAKRKWLSFQKARLNCSLPGNLPFYFDDIYDVYKDNDYYYALFYKQAGDLSASAICIYKKTDILQVLRGRFQYKNGNDNWVTLETDPSPRLDNCSLYEREENFDDYRSRYQLMDDTVKPVYGQPIFYQQGVQLMKIAVGNTQNSARNIYVASDEGKLFDIFFKEGNSGSLSDCIVKLNKIYEPFPQTDRSYAVWNMKLLENAVLLGTDYNVTRLTLDVCESIQNIDTCILDTRCVWDKCVKKCSARTEDDPMSNSCIINHDYIEPGTSLLKMLINNDAVQEVTPVNRKGIAGIYTTLEILYPVSRKLSRWKRSQLDHPEVEVDLEREVFKYALSSRGDLTIANTTFDDAGHYKAYDQDSNLIADYSLHVIDNTEDIIDAWKQQFSDWSMAFVKWKQCSHDFFQGCVNSP